MRSTRLMLSGFAGLLAAGAASPPVLHIPSGGPPPAPALPDVPAIRRTPTPMKRRDTKKKHDPAKVKAKRKAQRRARRIMRMNAR